MLWTTPSRSTSSGCHPVSLSARDPISPGLRFPASTQFRRLHPDRRPSSGWASSRILPRPWRWNRLRRKKPSKPLPSPAKFAPKNFGPTRTWNPISSRFTPPRRVRSAESRWWVPEASRPTRSRNHGRRFKAKTGFKCSICGKMLTSKPNLDGHYHSFHRKVTCPHCNVTVFGRNVRRHMRRAHREKYVEENPTRKCLSCNKTLIATYYQRHVKMFHQNFTCLQCDLRFTGERSYLDHFAAGKCGKSGVSEENFDLELEDDVLTTKDVNINGGWAPGREPYGPRN